MRISVGANQMVKNALLSLKTEGRNVSFTSVHHHSALGWGFSVVQEGKKKK